ncbi:MAG: efflux RND transporter periplasmic adaptor subunit [Sinobacterium sp.]|nr:efflux RND transporter periplasmic adaptor subunit [Sinobacterium sp.]
MIKNTSAAGMPRLITVIICTGLLIASLLALAKVNAPTSSDNYKDYLHTVDTFTLAAPQTLTVSREFSGRIEARQTLTLGFELAGTIASMNVNDGDFVKKGQRLAQLDNQLLEADLDKLSAQHTQIQAQLKLNIQTLHRQQTLKNKNYAAGQRLDELQAEKVQLQAKLRLIQTQKKQSKIRIKKSTLFAPFDGQISVRYRAQGGVVNPSEPVLELVEDSQLQIKVAVPLDFAQQLNVGQAVHIQTLNGAKNLQFDALIDTISRSVSLGSYTQTLRLSLPENINQTFLSNGQIVMANIQETRNEVGYWLPSTALTEGLRGTWNVLLLSEQDENKSQLQKMAVTPLHFKHSQVFIAESAYFKSGRKVVANGTQRLSNKQWVIAP